MTNEKECLTKEVSIEEKPAQKTGFAMLSGYLEIAKNCKNPTSEKEETKEQ